MDYSPPGSSVHGILQARILEWVAISFSRGTSIELAKNLFGFFCKMVWKICKMVWKTNFWSTQHCFQCELQGSLDKTINNSNDYNLIKLLLCIISFTRVLSRFSRVQLCVTPWTIATRFLCPWDFPGKNIGGGCHFLLQGIFPTQGWNPRLLCLLRWQAGFYH